MVVPPADGPAAPERPRISAAMVARSHGVTDPQWSPGGSLVGWLDSFDSRTDLVIAAADGSAPPAVVSADTPVSSAGSYGGGAWCFVDDETVAVCTQEGHLVLLRTDGGGVVRTLCPHGSASAPAVSPDRTRIAFALEDGDACDIAVVPVDGSAWPQRVSQGADYAWDPSWRADGGALAWHEWDLPNMSWDGSRIVMLELRDGAEPVVVAGGEVDGEHVAVGQPRFAPAGHALAFVSDRSGWWNVHVLEPGAPARPVAAEPHDHAEPAWGPGQRSFAWSPDGTRIAWCRNELGFGRLVVAPASGEGPVDELAKAWHRDLSWGPHGLLATRAGARTPVQLVHVDVATRERRVLARGPVAGFEAAGVSEPELIEWRSGDATVHGLLWRPSHPARGPHVPPPLYVHIHGGPTDQVVVGWNPRIAYWVDRGFAVLAPNYRGSSGYGRAYRDALTERWGEVDVDDVAAGIRAVVEQGWCDAERVVVVGGSAGGFTALLLAARHADIVSAAVSVFGVTDLFGLAASTHRFESRYLDRLVGPLPEATERYRRNSPINEAPNIRIPVLLLQGANDKVVPKAQADAMAEALEQAGAATEYRVYEGEGHGFRMLANVIDEYERTEAFLATWLLRR